MAKRPDIIDEFLAAAAEYAEAKYQEGYENGCAAGTGVSDGPRAQHVRRGVSMRKFDALREVFRRAREAK